MPEFDDGLFGERLFGPEAVVLAAGSAAGRGSIAGIPMVSYAASAAARGAAIAAGNAVEMVLPAPPAGARVVDWLRPWT